MHLLDLAEHVKAGVKDEGMIPFRFNTIGVSDGISMGTDGKSKRTQSPIFLIPVDIQNGDFKLY